MSTKEAATVSPSAKKAKKSEPENVRPVSIAYKIVDPVTKKAFSREEAVLEVVTISRNANHVVDALDSDRDVRMTRVILK